MCWGGTQPTFAGFEDGEEPRASGREWLLDLNESLAGYYWLHPLSPFIGSQNLQRWGRGGGKRVTHQVTVYTSGVGTPGQAGKEGPQLARTGASQGFPRAAAPVGVLEP